MDEFFERLFANNDASLSVWASFPHGSCFAGWKPALLGTGGPTQAPPKRCGVVSSSGYRYN